MADAPMKVPAAGYADPAQYKLEMERIFLKVPLLVALSCDVREPGDFLAYDLASRPIIVVRGDDGQVRTFLNVCRHRGARLTEEHCGSARRFTCPYHAWSYDSGGSLVGVPGKDSFGEIGATGLHELPTEERVGAVFSCLDPSATLDLDTWLAGFDEALATLRLDELHPYRVPTTIASPNWKLAADGYLDGYHIGYLHRNTIGRKAVTNRNTYDLFGPHVRIGFATKETMVGRRGGPRRGQPARLLQPRALRLPERVDLRRARRHADAEQAPAGRHRRPLDDGAVPVLPPAGGRRHGRRRRGEAPDLRGRRA